MISNESLVNTTLSRLEKGQQDRYIQFVNSPEGFLLNGPTQEDIPREKDVGNHGSVISDSCTEVVPVGAERQVWVHTGQVHKQV